MSLGLEFVLLQERPRLNFSLPRVAQIENVYGGHTLSLWVKGLSYFCITTPVTDLIAKSANWVLKGVQLHLSVRHMVLRRM